jgi:hypothetical protein
MLQRTPNVTVLARFDNDVVIVVGRPLVAQTIDQRQQPASPCNGVNPNNDVSTYVSAFFSRYR